MSDASQARRIQHRYRDPLDEVWLACARELGLRVERTDEVFASYDGRGTLTIGTPATLDPDDCLAQIIFHEVCHGLVAQVVRDLPPGAPDWGMQLEPGERDLRMEHACHRLQAALAGAHGLRDFMAVTTEHRPYWDSLPADPLQAGASDTRDGVDPALALARAAHAHARDCAWSGPLARALAATAAIAAVVRPCAAPNSLWSRTR